MSAEISAHILRQLESKLEALVVTITLLSKRQDELEIRQTDVVHMASHEALANVQMLLQPMRKDITSLYDGVSRLTATCAEMFENLRKLTGAP